MADSGLVLLFDYNNNATIQSLNVPNTEPNKGPRPAGFEFIIRSLSYEVSIS